MTYLLTLLSPGDIKGAFRGASPLRVFSIFIGKETEATSDSFGQWPRCIGGLECPAPTSLEVSEGR
jgi:hypothetical protein